MTSVANEVCSLVLLSKGDRDSLGIYKRQLATLAQVYSGILDELDTAVLTLSLAMDERLSGFAGFQAPAYFMLAEAIYICNGGYHSDIDRCLARAQTAAHNIQDARFCTKITSRSNAMKLRWWDSSKKLDVVAIVNRICQNPVTSEFAALHIVGEDYAERVSGANKLPLPELFTSANTLDAIAQIYQKSIVELQRLNDEWDAHEPLPKGTQVNIPDVGFANLLSARLSAESLVSPKLSSNDRVKLIQSLVPLAVLNPTVLDTVLSRLLIAAHPKEAGVLDDLDAILKKYLS
jgi:hypothetical protein